MSLYRTHSLDHIFDPQTVAVIGASETPHSVGRSLMLNLLNSSFDGRVYPVNLHRESVLGIPAVTKIKDVAEPVDLAIIATPAKSVTTVVEECAAADVKGAIIISAGFGETDRAGKRLERRVSEVARHAKLRIIGPNCLGVMNPYRGLNATFASQMPRSGTVGLISQSGAMLSALLDWAVQENAGFSKVISIGAMLDVDWSDVLYYLGDDSHTRSIVIYMESIGNVRGFVSAAREVARRKPIVVLKAGRTAQTERAVVAHTGAPKGDDAVIDAALRRCGVLRVERIAQLFYMAGVLSKQPRPRGPNLTIVTNAGGAGILAADALIAGGGQLTRLSAETIAELDKILPTYWSHNNPIDILGDATPSRFAAAVEIAAKDEQTNGLLVILTPQDMTEPTETAEAVRRVISAINKPVLTSWMGGLEIADGEKILNQAEIATLSYPDSAAHIFDYMWRYSRAIERLYETPTSVASYGRDGLLAVEHLLEQAHHDKRTELTAFESAQTVSAYGMPTVSLHLALSADEAADTAQTIGFPVELRLNSHLIMNVSEVDGVWRNLLDVESVRQAFRAIEATVTLHMGRRYFQGVTVQAQVETDANHFMLGSTHDSQFGPVIHFGITHKLSDMADDVVLGLPPLTSTLARHLLDQSRLLPASAADPQSEVQDQYLVLTQLLVRFSYLVSEQRRVKSVGMLLNRIDEGELLVVNAEIVLHDWQIKDADLMRPAIRPYPNQYANSWTMRNGTEVMIRPIRPEDEPLMAAFNRTLSKDTIFLRYFYPVSVAQLTDHDRLARFCFIDYDLEMALVVEESEAGPSTGKSESEENTQANASIDSPFNGSQIIGVGQLVRLHDHNVAEFALLVADGYQQQGLGTELLARLLNIARDEGIDTVIGSILPQNRGMKRICEELGFSFTREPGSNAMLAEISLSEPDSANKQE